MTTIYTPASERQGALNSGPSFSTSVLPVRSMIEQPCCVMFRQARRADQCSFPSFPFRFWSCSSTSPSCCRSHSWRVEIPGSVVLDYPSHLRVILYPIPILFLFFSFLFFYLWRLRSPALGIILDVIRNSIQCSFGRRLQFSCSCACLVPMWIFEVSSLFSPFPLLFRNAFLGLPMFSKVWGCRGEEGEDNVQ